MIPLINVVFLLLIFFMLAGQLSATDPFKVTPPRSSSEAPAGARELVVAMAADGRMAVGGQIVTEDELAGLASERIEETPGLTVMLKADGGAPAVDVIAAMEVLRRSGAGQVRLMTLESEER